MIHRIATILKDRIAAFTYVDKIGGLAEGPRNGGRDWAIPYNIKTYNHGSTIPRG